jgi:hypothetical protein
MSFSNKYDEYHEAKENEEMFKYLIDNVVKMEIQDNYISKDKIKELREIDNIDYLQFKLKELLGE